MVKTVRVVKLKTRGKTVRTAFGLRDLLFDELDDLRAGKSTAQKAGAISRVAREIVSSVKMEIERQKHLATIGGSATGAPATLQLGRQ